MSKDLSARYYQRNKEKIQRKSRERYKNLSEREHNKKQQYCCKRFKNL